MFLSLLTRFVVIFCIASIPTACFAHFLKRKGWLPAHTLLIASLSLFSCVAYLSFWACFEGRRTGIIFILLIYLIAAGYLIKAGKQLKELFISNREFTLPLLFMFLVGIGYTSVLCLYTPPKGDPCDLAAHRFNDLPIDNSLPVIFADRLQEGARSRQLFGDGPNDWLSSDRPPLQVGIILTTRVLLRHRGLSRDYDAFGASLWFQLFWIPALWALLRTLGASVRQTAIVITITLFTGFSLLYSLYTWPKFGAAAFVLGGISILLSKSFPSAVYRWAFAAMMLALGNLSHGGTAFALLGLALIVFIPQYRPSLLALTGAVVVFAALNGPWIAYQKFFDPPGNRLLKMHLAGVNDVDSRGLSTTLVERYRSVGWQEACKYKLANFSRFIEGDFTAIYNFSTERNGARSRRDEEFFFLLRALCFGNLALLFSPIAIYLLKRKTGTVFIDTYKTMMIFGWIAATLIIWCILMFMPGSCVIHQGSLAPVLAIFSIAMLLLLVHSRIGFVIVALLQIASFLTTWMPANPSVQTPLSLSATTLSIVCAGLLFWIVLAIKNDPSDPDFTPCQKPSSSPVLPA
jgi:hypothetical protein